MSDLIDGAVVPWNVISGDESPPIDPGPTIYGLERNLEPRDQEDE